MKNRWFAILVMLYMLLAIGWWGVLLFNKNKQVYQLRYQIEEESPHLAKEYRKDRWMIIGEGVVLGLTLVAGIWIINQGVTRELVAANNQKNFLLSVSHELKTPIAAIKLALQTLQRPKVNAAMQQQLLTKALQDTDRLQAMVQNIVLSAAMDNEKIELHREKFNLIELIEQLEDKSSAKQLTTFSIKKSSQRINFNGDRMALYHAFSNIVNNAIKYNTKPNITISVDMGANQILINIIDDGIGIPDEHKTKVFERFYRINTSEKRNSSTGLGLYLSKAIIEAHDGSIHIVDNTPSGSKVIITLPSS